MPTSKKPGLFYGYWIVAIAFLCVFVESGVGGYLFPLFYKPLQTEFGWSRSTIAAAFTISYIVPGLASPFIGRMVDHYGARKVIPLGALAAGLGFVWLSFMQNLWSFYVGYLVTGMGFTIMGGIPSTQVVSNWFNRRRGMAVGIMATGVGAGGMVLAPLVGAYLLPAFGWRASYFLMALLTWVLIIPLSLLVIRSRPEDKGLYPDGIKAPETVTTVNLSSRAAEGWTLNMALKTSTLYLIGIAFLTTHFSQCGTVQHQVNILNDAGFTVSTAATSLGIVGLGSVLGKLLFGWLCDRMPAKYVGSISFSLQLVAIIVLMNVKATSPLTMLWGYSILMGLGIGGWMPAVSMLVSRNYGLTSYGTIFGVMSLALKLGCSTGPLVTGYIFDVTHTYYWAFIVFLALFLVAIPSLLAVRRPKLLTKSSG